MALTRSAGLPFHDQPNSPRPHVGDDDGRARMATRRAVQKEGGMITIHPPDRAGTSMSGDTICPHFEDHTPRPEGYIAWHEWAKRMGKTHRAIKCGGCGLYAIWVPKTPRAICAAITGGAL